MKTVWVYKTDVNNFSKAKIILDEIYREFPDSDLSFDLDDCDKVLRVEHPEGSIDEEKIFRIMKKQNVQIDTLP